MLRIVKPEGVAPRFARPSYEKPELIRPRVDIIGANVETRHEWRVIEKPEMVKPVHDTNLRIHRPIDFRVDRLQESGECEYCKTGLKSFHRYHTHPSVIAATNPLPPRPKEEELREQVPARELYQREVAITNRFHYWYPLSVQQAERGSMSIRELQPIR
jgi:hypothetical protein